MKDSSNFIVHGNAVGMAHRHRRKVRSFCTKEPEIIREATRGAQIATAECQFQFCNRRWNYSSFPKSIRRILDRGKKRNTTWKTNTYYYLCKIYIFMRIVKKYKF